MKQTKLTNTMYAGAAAERAEGAAKMEVLYTDSDEESNDVVEVTLTEEHGEGFIFLHDYLNQRMTPGKFSICDKCPNTPSPTASYRLTCPKHNQ